jgi:hypothetical protein
MDKLNSQVFSLALNYGSIDCLSLIGLFSNVETAYVCFVPTQDKVSHHRFLGRPDKRRWFAIKTTATHERSQSTQQFIDQTVSPQHPRGLFLEKLSSVSCQADNVRKPPLFFALTRIRRLGLPITENGCFSISPSCPRPLGIFGHCFLCAVETEGVLWFLCISFYCRC